MQHGRRVSYHEHRASCGGAQARHPRRGLGSRRATACRGARRALRNIAHADPRGAGVTRGRGPHRAPAQAGGGDGKAAVDDQISWNEEFHRIIVDGADSPRLQAAMRGVAGIPRAFRTAFWASESERTKSLFYHREIVRAMEARLPDLAEAVMRVHILNAGEFLAEVMRGDDEH